MKSNDLHNFKFIKNGSGSYFVYYFTEKRGDFWRATINDMTIIDATKNAEVARVKDILRLRYLVKLYGSHFGADGRRID